MIFKTKCQLEKLNNYGWLNEEANVKRPSQLIPWYVRIATIFGIINVFAFGFLNEFIYTLQSLYEKKPRDNGEPWSLRLILGRQLLWRMWALFNRPVASAPGASTTILERTTTDGGRTHGLSGRRLPSVINFGSYNYLGFAENSGPCSSAAKKALRELGVATASAKIGVGEQWIVGELESEVASFLGVDSAVAFPMGFTTNSLVISCLVGEGCLILSDELNHTSLIIGCKCASGTVVRKFAHNDMEQLEEMLSEALQFGQPDNGTPFRKILIIVEGIYSMEGTIVDLPAVLALKKRFNAYLWLDEAHSIGALGRTGRGVVEHFGCQAKDVDVLMGTFTKSFAGCGGYIAGSKALIAHLRVSSPGLWCGGGLSGPVTAQSLAALRLLRHEGSAKLTALAVNTRELRRRLRGCALCVLGDDASPVLPVLVCLPSAFCRLSPRLLEEYGIAVVSAGIPATPILTARVRLCVSSAHTEEMIDQIVDALGTVGGELGITFASQI